MDKTIAPARQPILDEMYSLLSNLDHTLIIASGQEVDKIKWQSNNLRAIVLGQNGNHAVDYDDNELWNIPLEKHQKEEIFAHIESLKALLDHELNEDWKPIEDRGA